MLTKSRRKNEGIEEKSTRESKAWIEYKDQNLGVPKGVPYLKLFLYKIFGRRLRTV